MSHKSRARMNNYTIIGLLGGMGGEIGEDKYKNHRKKVLAVTIKLS